MLGYIRCLTLALSVGLLAFSTTALAKSPGVFNPKTFTLANGLQVVVISNHRAPVVTQMVWYRAGSKDDPIGKSGIAHFLEHLMFKGTPDVPAGRFVEIISRNGGQQNAFTTRDYTVYFQEVVSDKIETIIELEAGRMSDLAFLPDLVETERAVIIEERRMRIDNKPQAILLEAANAAFFWHHPYGRPIIGWEHEMKTLNRDDAIKFYKTWYVPNNATLVFAGDVTVDKVKPLVEKYYGTIPRRQLPERQLVDEPTHRNVAQRIALSSQLVDHPNILFVYPAPNIRDNIKEVHAISVLTYILGEGATSKLYRSLIQQQKIAASINIGYDPGYFGPASFTLHSQPTPGNSIKALELAIKKELQTLLKQGVTRKEVENAKRRIIAGIAYVKDGSFGGAEDFGKVFSTNRKIDDIELWPEHIKAVTAEQVNTALKKIFSAKEHLTALLLPTAQKKKIS